MEEGKEFSAGTAVLEKPEVEKPSQQNSVYIPAQSIDMATPVMPVPPGTKLDIEPTRPEPQQPKDHWWNKLFGRTQKPQTSS